MDPERSPATDLREIQTLAWQSSPMFVVYDVAGIVLDASISYCSLVGRPLDAVKGRPWPDLVVGEEALGREQLRYSLTALATQDVLVVDMPTRADGEARWFRWTEWAVRDETGCLVQVRSTAIDITDLHEARAAVAAGLDAVVHARALGRRDVLDRLHDGALQQLTAARWAIQAGDQASAASLVDSAIAAVSDSMDTLSTPGAPPSRLPANDPFWRTMMVPARSAQLPDDLRSAVADTVFGAVALVSATGSVWLEPNTRRGMFDEHTDIDVATLLAEVHPDDRDAVAAAIVQALGGNDAWVQWRFRDSEHRWRHIYSWLTPLAEVRNRPNVAVALSMDLTELDGDSLRDVMAAQLAERHRVARDLHDDVLQRLAGLRWALVAAGVEPRLVDDVDEIDAAIRVELGRLRSAVARFGLVVALQQLADSSATPCSLDLPAGLDTLPVDIADQLWRVAREGLHNVDRHADASVVNVTVRRFADRVELDIVDDGTGLEPGRVMAALRAGHLGVATMREAVVAMGGVIELGPASGAGTRLGMMLPLDDRQR